MGYHNVVPNPHLVCINMPYWEGNHHFRVQKASNCTCNAYLLCFVSAKFSAIGFGNHELGHVTKHKSWLWKSCKISHSMPNQIYGDGCDQKSEVWQCKHLIQYPWWMPVFAFLKSVTNKGKVYTSKFIKSWDFIKYVRI